MTLQTIQTRAEAKALGQARYFTGKPCKRGHVAERYTGNGDCCGCETARLKSEHSIARLRQYRQTDRHRTLHKSAKFKHLYGLSREQYEARLREQNYSCAICLIPFDSSNHTTKPCVDHNHSTGTVRDILCDACNKLLGMAKDNPRTLLRATQYLVRHQFSQQRIALAS